VTSGRVLHAALHLLDRQLRDRHGRLCGNVDDLELERDGDDGPLYVTAVLSGPGNLLYRLGRRRAGRWLRAIAADVVPSTLDDPGRIPCDRISSIGTTVDLAVDADQLATHAGERWVREHVIGHIPGSRHRADQ